MKHKIKTVLIALMAFSVIASGAIGMVSAQQEPVMPFEEEGISDTAEEIEFTATGVSDFGEETEVTVNVEVWGYDNETDETTELETYVLTVEENSSAMDYYNVSEEDRENYDSFVVTADTQEEVNQELIDTFDINVITSDGGGGAFDATSIIEGDTFGIPNVLIVALLGVGGFLLLNKRDEFSG